MRARIGLFILLLSLVFCSYGAIHAQTSNPISESIVKHGLSAQIIEVARLPDTRELYSPDRDAPGFARISYVRDLPDGRRFANDSRGLLYLLNRNNRPSLYADVSAAFPFSFYASLQSGFIGFEFHPEFAQNGLFYTVHGESAANNPATPNFIPPGFISTDVTFHSVVTEWHATTPAANVFNGTRREILRVGHVVDFFRHPIGHVGFNPVATPVDPGYGFLYISIGDLGFSNGGGPHANNPGQLQRLDTMAGTILRIDPRSPSESGGIKGIGDYTIPPSNVFAADGDPNTLGEIYAHGFRNAHRLSWDLSDGTMFASDIGLNHIEEINIVYDGANYGWMQREGPFDNGISRPGSTLSEVFSLPTEIMETQNQDEFVYPVAMYDHNDGQSITGGFSYHGRIAALRGKFVFGDIVRGRLFIADLNAMKEANDGIPKTVAAVEELQLYIKDASGDRTYVTLRELIEATMGATITRADLQISRSQEGELFITSRQDGVIRMLVPDP